MKMETKRHLAQLLVMGSLGTLCLLGSLQIWSQWQLLIEENTDALRSLDMLRGISAYSKTWVPKSGSNDQQISTLFMQDASNAIVDANLLGKLKELSQQQSIEISRTSAATPRPEGGLIWHDVIVDISGPNNAIVQFINTIETATPALFIERLQIQSSVQPGVPLQTEPVMTAQMTVSAATRAPTPATSQKTP
jgi:Type II secretion system (T2SS), protein M subtype b